MRLTRRKHHSSVDYRLQIFIYTSIDVVTRNA